MSILVVGLSHRSAPVAVLERVAVAGDDLVKLLHDVHESAHVAESAVVSTCNRVEIYAAVEKFHPGVSAITELLSRHSGVLLDELHNYLYVHYEDRAIQHAFSVACGLESMVVGEGQILGQVREALKLAQRRGTVGRALHEVMQQALRVGKRAHTETGIDQVGASLVSVGLAGAADHLGSLPGRRALVVGAGSMSALTVATLSREGVGEIIVANRTLSRAVRLAGGAAVPARAIGLADIGAALAGVDIVVSCVGAHGLVLTADMVAPAVAGPDGGGAAGHARSPSSAGGDAEAGAPRRMFFLDLALPHDIDRSIGTLPGVALTGLDDLRTAQDATHAIGPKAVEAVRRIVAEEVAAFLSAARAAAVTPTVIALRSKAAEVVDAELTRLGGRLPDLAAKERGEIEQAVRRVVDKLLHAPTVRVKELAAGPGGDTYAAALRELFDLDPNAPEAVTRADIDETGPSSGEGAQR